MRNNDRILRYYKSIIFIGIILFLSYSCRKDEAKVEVVILPVNPALQKIFDIEKVPHITLEISTNEWNRLLENFDINRNNEEYVLGNFTILIDNNVTRLDSIGLRLRGNTSRRRPEGTTGEVHQATNPDWHHVHFSLNFKKYRKSQRYQNLERMNLKWFKDDANYVREVYSYDLFERFGVWTAPQSSYCMLTIKILEDEKPAYFGVYQMIESIDEDFLSNRANSFVSPNGNLWKCTWGANLRVPDQTLMGVEDATLDPNTMVTYIYDLKTNEKSLDGAKNQLSDFIGEFNSTSGDNFKVWVDKKIDVPLLLKTYAVNVMVGMWDDYWANSNNYYMYFDADGRFYFIPYDYDNTLGTSLMMDSGTKNFLNWGNSHNPLIKKIIEIPEYKTMYVKYLHDLVKAENDYFHVDKSTPRIEAWQAMIGPYVTNDTGEDMVIDDFPAPWGNQPQYRLNTETNNFFIFRSSNLPPN